LEKKCRAIFLHYGPKFKFLANFFVVQKCCFLIKCKNFSSYLANLVTKVRRNDDIFQIYWKFKDVLEILTHSANLEGFNTK
jgi:hypothetical protein